jgi:hypothetical protein
MRPLALASLLALCACANVSSSAGPGVCPESASLSCLTTPQCSWDTERHCKVCECTKGIYNAVPPDQRLRQ